ncbi:hypothetical protein FMM05_00095 [Flavobacterium zepuense]|uniref:VanZ like family protein n=1 Tax=Flavobacterium zepuense TaxID=2593302 RepID=A0A552V9E1_9FLAO|nr:hypothetical protein [Flavobacterium zepuense]TRW27086.1 hypothetical protein FMM05_00095 [Flavobacterium zepuense]
MLLNKNRRITLIAIFIAVLVFTAFMELGLRAYLFTKLGNDSVLAGSMPNFVAVVLITFIYAIIKERNKQDSVLKISLMGCLIMVFYELIQPLIAGRTFDWFDILASFLGGIFCYCVLNLVNYCTKAIS